MHLARILVVALASLATVFVSAHDYATGDIKVAHPYTRSTPPGAKTAGAYLSIDNRGKVAERLMRASSPAAGMVELHSMSMDGNIMRMRAIPAIELPAGKTVALAPGGLHLMLQDLKRPLKKGERIPVTLTFERSGDLKVELSVEDPVDAGKGAAAHASH